MIPHILATLDNGFTLYFPGFAVIGGHLLIIILDHKLILDLDDTNLLIEILDRLHNLLILGRRSNTLEIQLPILLRRPPGVPLLQIRIDLPFSLNQHILDEFEADELLLVEVEDPTVRVLLHLLLVLLLDFEDVVQAGVVLVLGGGEVVGLTVGD